MVEIVYDCLRRYSESLTSAIRLEIEEQLDNDA